MPVQPPSSASILKPGLYVTATPIGRLEDLSQRAKDTLEQADWICAEDSRETTKLLLALGIKRPPQRMLSLHAHNEARQIPQVLSLLGQSCSVALVSDAGTPGISDPGARLIQATWASGFRVSPIPGASAVIAAASVSGFLTDADRPLTFWGFLPTRESARRARYTAMLNHPGVSVCFEAPHRIHESLATAEAILGDQCELMLAREMTKSFERFIRGNAASIRAQLADDLAQDRYADHGEMVLVLSPRVQAHTGLTPELRDLWMSLLSGRLSKPQAAKLLAEALHISREEAYDLLLEAGL
ncbi:MAG: 16S rRNA (cytidine(1402)-2'-O)-methyltransferase [Burkholderiaceae bacterium]